MTSIVKEAGNVKNDFPSKALKTLCLNRQTHKQTNKRVSNPCFYAFYHNCMKTKKLDPGWRGHPCRPLTDPPMETEGLTGGDIKTNKKKSRHYFVDVVGSKLKYQMDPKCSNESTFPQNEDASTQNISPDEDQFWSDVMNEIPDLWNLGRYRF